MDAREKWREVRALDTPVSLRLGPNTVDRFLGDPKRLSFMFARYAFAAKMLQGCESILEVGCGDGLGTLTFLSDTRASDILGVDFDEDLIRYALSDLMPAVSKARPDEAPRVTFLHADFLSWNFPTFFAGACSLDCIEHIDPAESHAFLGQLADALSPRGIAVIGTPNEYAAHLGSAHSQVGHINNFTPARLRAELGAHFQTVFLFGLNDATLHVGHEHLWHYILAVAVKA